MKSARLQCAAGWLAMFALATPAHAAPASIGIAMSATVTDACVVSNSSTLPLEAPSTAASQKVGGTGTISVACTSPGVAKVAIDGRGLPGTERFGSLAVTDGSGDFAGYGTHSDSGVFPVIAGGRSLLEQPPAAPSIPPVSFTLFGTVLCNVELSCARRGQSCDVRSKCKTSTPQSCPAHNCASGLGPVTVEPEQNAWNVPCEIDGADHGVSTGASASAGRDGALYHQTEGLYVSVDF